MINQSLVAWLKSEACANLLTRLGSLTVAQILTHAYNIEPTHENIKRYQRDIGETMTFAGYVIRQVGKRDKRTGVDERIRAYVKGKKRTLDYFLAVMHRGSSGRYQAYGRFYHSDLDALKSAAQTLVKPGYRILIYQTDVTKDRHVPIAIYG